MMRSTMTSGRVAVTRRKGAVRTAGTTMMRNGQASPPSSIASPAKQETDLKMHLFFPSVVFHRSQACEK
jgi:hypothetical protein